MKTKSVIANVILGTASLTVLSGAYFLNSHIDKRIENMKEIKEKDPDRYYRLLEYTAATKEGVYSSTGQLNTLWAEEAGRMNDSLRLDSIAKSNYAKGILAVDSLKTGK